MGIIIRKAQAEDAGNIRLIAEKTWPVAYSHIISAAQLSYMIDMMYSLASLSLSIANEKDYFLIAEDHQGKPTGFAGFRKNFLSNNRFKLDKLYILPEHQGHGIGKSLIQTICQIMLQEKVTILELNVNRNNQAKLFYEKMGFKLIRSEDIDIGNGYFMNDYVMELHLDHYQTS